MARYKEESGFILKIMAETGAVIEPMSIDEAYLNLSARCQGEDADASLQLCVPIARQLKERILSERALTATIGIASNKLARRPSQQLQPHLQEQLQCPSRRLSPAPRSFGILEIREGEGPNLTRSH